MQVFGNIKNMEQFDNINKLEAKILNFDKMQERKVWVELETGAMTEVTSYKAIWNTKKFRVEAVLTDKYTLIQHTDVMLPIVDTIRELGSDAFGGLYCDGKRAYVVAIMKDERFKINVNGDELQLGILLRNSVDGTSAVVGEAFGFRYICQNGNILGNLVSSVFRIHRGSVSSAIKDFYKKLVENIMKNSERLNDIIQRAMAERIEQAWLETVLVGADFGKRYRKKILEKIRHLDQVYKWDLYNAITEFITHEVEKAKFNTRLAYLKKGETVLITEAETLFKLGIEKLRMEQHAPSLSSF